MPSAQIEKMLFVDLLVTRCTHCQMKFDHPEVGALGLTLGRYEWLPGGITLCSAHIHDYALRPAIYCDEEFNEVIYKWVLGIGANPLGQAIRDWIVTPDVFIGPRRVRCGEEDSWYMRQRRTEGWWNYTDRPLSHAGVANNE